MPQNIYDNPDFFAGHKQLRDTASGLNGLLEQPALRALLPNLTGLSVLELGCGMGQFARWCIEQGVARVTAVDVSEKMLDVARQANALPHITYVQSSIEDCHILDLLHKSPAAEPTPQPPAEAGRGQILHPFASGGPGWAKLLRKET